MNISMKRYHTIQEMFSVVDIIEHIGSLSSKTTAQVEAQ
jgi:hypothetical protein